LVVSSSTTTISAIASSGGGLIIAASSTPLGMSYYAASFGAAAGYLSPFIYSAGA